MTKKLNEKTIISSIIFIIIDLIYLISHFTWWGCIPVAICILYYFLKADHIQTAEEAAEQGISAWWGMYIGSTCLCMFVISALFFGFFPVDLSIGEMLSGSVVTILVVLGSSLIGLLLSRSYQQTILKCLLRYVIVLGSMFYVLYFVMHFQFTDLIYGMVALLFASFYIEFCINGHNEKNSVISFNFLLLSWLFLGVLCLMQSSFVARIVTYANYGFSGWTGENLLDVTVNGATEATPFLPTAFFSTGHILAGALLFAAGGAISFFRRKDTEKEALDVRVYISLAAFLFLLLALRQHSTTYNNIFLLLYMIDNIIFIGVNVKPTPIGQIWQLPTITLENVKFLFHSLFLVLLPITYYHGAALKFLCVILGILGIFQFWKHDLDQDQKDENVPFWKRKGFWLYLIGVTAVFAAISVWKGNGTARNYSIVGLIVLLSVVVFAITDFQNSRMYKSRHISTMIVSILVILVLAFKVGSISSFGVPVEHSPDLSEEELALLRVEFEPQPEPEPEIITWQKTYLQFIDESQLSDSTVGSILYIDNDVIPELLLKTDEEHSVLLTFYQDKLYTRPVKEAIKYIPRKSLLLFSTKEESYDEEGNYLSRYSTDDIYVYGRGVFNIKERGDLVVYANTEVPSEASWNGEAVTTEEYSAHLSESFDSSQSLTPQSSFTVADLRVLLSDGTEDDPEEDNKLGDK